MPVRPRRNDKNTVRDDGIDRSVPDAASAAVFSSDIQPVQSGTASVLTDIASASYDTVDVRAEDSVSYVDYDSTSDMYFLLSATGRLILASDSFAARIPGVEAGADAAGLLRGAGLSDLYAEASRLLDSAGRAGDSSTAIFNGFPDNDGITRRVRAVCRLLRISPRAPLMLLCILRDIERECEEHESYLNEVRYLMRPEAELQYACFIDIDSWRIVSVAGAASGDGMSSASNTIGENANAELDSYISAEAAAASGSEEANEFFTDFNRARLLGYYRDGLRRHDIEYRRTAADGSTTWVHFILRMMTDPLNGHVMAVINIVDINKAKAAQSELLRAAEIDAMTNVLNHDATLKYIESYLTGDGANGHHALLMIDRDSLKKINDTFGHQVGDDIIVETARVLITLFRDTDIVGRVGGDEYMVLMKNIGKVENVRRKAAELLQALQYICGPADNAIETTGSIGISLYDGDGKTLDKLFAEADAALYQAKADGRNRLMLYTTGQNGDLITDARDTLADTINLRTLLNSIDGGIIILHIETGNIPIPVFFSDSFLTMMGGLTQNEAFAVYGENFFNAIHPDERERVVGEYAAAVESGEPLRTTYRLKGKDGIFHWLSAGTNLIKNPDGRIDIYAVHTNIEKLMHREEKLASDERRFRMAFAQTQRMLFEYDFSNDTILLFTRDGVNHVADKKLTGVPSAIIDSGFVGEESKEKFTAFVNSILAGSPEGSGLFNCRYFSNSQYGWMSVTYQSVFDSEGKPVRTIGGIEEMPNIERAQRRLESEKALLHAGSTDLIAALEINITRDTVNVIHTVPDSGFDSVENGSKYTEFSERLFASATYPEDLLLLRVNFNADALVSSYAAGKHWSTVEYRRIDSGEIRWTKVTVCLAEAPVSRELYAFLYAGDIERRRSAEALLPVVTERDSVTHLYTQATMEKLIASMLRTANSREKNYSLALIRMGGLSELSAKIGTEGVDIEKTYVCRMFCVLLDGFCFVGRYGNDGILAFCPDSQSDEWMRDNIAAAVLRVRLAGNEQGIKLIAGVSTESAFNADFAGMLAQTMRICESNINAVEDTVLTFEQYVESYRNKSGDVDDGRSEVIAVPHEEIERPLFGVERSALADCMAAMLAADSYDNSVHGALAVIGQYYRAQKVYILSYIRESDSVTGMHEWLSVGRHSTMKQMTGVPLARLPIFKKVLTIAQPVILDSRSSGRRFRPDADAPWCFIVLPVIAEGKVNSFFCIENPEEHKTEVALPAVLLPKIMHERDRYNLGGTGLRVTGCDELTGLPDRTSYDNTMRSFNPDAYHSVGVIYVSAINLREMNREHGVKYGDDILIFTAQTLREVAKNAQVFRMSGQEFAVVCVNLSREAFSAHCARIQSMLRRRYPKSFNFGDAWSGKGASARKLLNDAESIANGGSEKTTKSIGESQKKEARTIDVREGLQTGRFFICLQPQVDMRTGSVIGAEVLARYRDSDGKTVLPSEFVGLFETAGIVRELDYLMLDRACSVLQNWVARGITPLTLSINFSRQTLLSQSVLASILAIRSRYDIPDDKIEIELTESVGDYEPDALRHIMESLNAEGFRFSLDDLGSEYSSLKTLGDFRFELVKLDRSLIANFLYNSVSRSVVESIVSLCAKNNIICVAEGVEAQAQAKGLMDVGCTRAQGYFYGKPMPVEDFNAKYMK